MIGAFAEALHAHRLRSIRTGIEGAGFNLARPGSLQIASDDVIEAIAIVMRTDPASLRAVAFSAASNRGIVGLGGVDLPRAIFDLDRRRIGPVELRDRNFHRTDWLNLLLPYCPQSLEQLVDCCPFCGPLGWRITRGVANCDQCGEAVPPSDAQGLDQETVGPYRFAADLMSSNHVVGTAAAARLPEAIQRFSRTALCDVMIRAGVVFGGTRSGHVLAGITAQPPAEIAQIVSTGAKLIAGWPRSIREDARARTDSMENDLTAYDAFRVDLRWVAQGSKDGQQLVTMAFPTLDGRTSNPFAGARRYYTATQTSTKLWTDSAELTALRDHRAIGFEKLPSNRRLRARYDADDVDALRLALDSGVSPGAAASTLDVPVYALGQFVDAARLDLREEPGVRVLRGVQIAKPSIDVLMEKLTRATSDCQPPGGLMAVKRLLAGYPGEKPWGECLKLLLQGDVKFYAASDAFSFRDLLLEPSDLPELRSVIRAIESDPIGLARIPLRDAYEVLGAAEQEATIAIRSAQLEILNDGRGKSVCRRELQELATMIAFTGEVAVHEKAPPVATYHRLAALRIPRVHGAWSRDALIERGMVRPMRVGDPS